MKKRVTGRILSRPASQRKALLSSLARSLVLHEKIKTTEARGKELRGYAERFITQAKKGDIASRRQLNRYFDNATVTKMIAEIAPRYQTRPGGYTRLLKLGKRKSDGAPMVIIELLK